MRYANMFILLGDGRFQDLITNYDQLDPYSAAVYWRFLYEQCGGMREGVENPNKELIREIIASGGQVILCGQTAGARNISKDQLLPGVQLSLSAMTALTALQQQGYQIILW